MFSNFFKRIIRLTENFFKVSCTLFIICLFFLSLLAIAKHFTPHFCKVYHGNYAVANTDNISAEEKRTLERLIQKGRIIPISDVYGHTLDYYDSLVSVLIAIIGVFAIVAWFSMRAKIEDSVIESINSEHNKEFLVLKIKEIIDENYEIFQRLNERDLIDRIKKEISEDNTKAEIVPVPEEEVK